MIIKKDNCWKAVFSHGTLLVSDAYITNPEVCKIPTIVMSQMEHHPIGSTLKGTAGNPWVEDGIQIIFDNYEGFEVFKHYVDEIDRNYRLRKWGDIE